jgi:hypothetical protein
MRSVMTLMAAGILGAAVAAAGEPAADVAKPKPPLAGLPSAPGPHIEKIKAMGDDSWLDLGKPAPDPKWGMGYGRAYLPNLAWAPDLKCAFICGTGVHGETHKYPDGATRWENDVWAYDLWAHRWICLYPGVDIEKGSYKVDEKSGATTEDGRGTVMGVHSYQQFCYDPAAKKFVIAGLDVNTDYLAKRLKEEFYRGGEKSVAKAKHWAPFVYDPATDEWKLHHASGATLRGFGGHHVFYSPKLKRIVAASPGSLYEYDMEKEAWTARQVQNTAKVGYNICCYDTKRDRILFTGAGPAGQKKGAPGILAELDVAGGEVKLLNSEGLEGLGSNDWMSGSNITYDQSADAVVLVVGDNLLVYDCGADKWLPKRVPGIKHSTYCQWSTFYVPELNVHIIHESGDSRPTQRILAYRYKRAADAK